jgi:hypothetical protein
MAMIVDVQTVPHRTASRQVSIGSIAISRNLREYSRRSSEGSAATDRQSSGLVAQLVGTYTYPCGTGKRARRRAQRRRGVGIAEAWWRAEDVLPHTSPTAQAEADRRQRCAREGVVRVPHDARTTSANPTSAAAYPLGIYAVWLNCRKWARLADVRGARCCP